ncbi:hypothetical protein [Actinomadura harenae]|uniref:Uncharacterized protein n=1 Tax=Actinomadura harenae TaxID=2483351 RepID=A0A3M2M445_9ACTN|nr:hypothetical protein [Actinomadura harenae]RMI43840.1 hypothetical protein EBO15_15380 [Actinomadura harenae]
MDDVKKSVRPVLDPDLSPEMREALLSAPETLVPASRKVPSGRRVGRPASGADLAPPLPVATLCGFMPILAFPNLLNRTAAGVAVGAVAQLGLAAVWWFNGFWTFLLAGTALQVLSFVGLLVSSRDRDKQPDLARIHHGRYYMDDDFSGSLRSWFGISPRRLMRRAQNAVAAVLESDVNAAGLLDDAAYTAALSRQEWEIAQELAELSRIGRELKATAGAGGPVGELPEPVARQRLVLKESVDALRRRIEALERYADQVRSADAAYRRRQKGQPQAQAEIGAGARVRLVRADPDDPPVDEIEGIGEGGEVGDLADRAADEALHDRLRKAREAAPRFGEQV